MRMVNVIVIVVGAARIHHRISIQRLITTQSTPLTQSTALTQPTQSTQSTQSTEAPRCWDLLDLGSFFIHSSHNIFYLAKVEFCHNGTKQVGATMAQYSSETNALLTSSSPMSPQSPRTETWPWICGLVVACFVGAGLILGRPSAGYGSATKADATQNDYPLLGKKKDKKGPQDPLYPCDDGGYSKRTLKLAYELPFASLFRDTKGQKKYEASSVVIVGDSAYAVCDSSWAISKVLACRSRRLKTGH